MTNKEIINKLEITLKEIKSAPLELMNDVPSMFFKSGYIKAYEDIIALLKEVYDVRKSVE